MIIGSIEIKLFFAWYDIWIGLFYDRPKRRIYFLPIPCFGLRIQFGANPYNLPDIFGELERDPWPSFVKPGPIMKDEKAENINLENEERII